MTFLRTIINSVYSPEFYRSAPSRSLWAALRYFALLSLLAACLSVVSSSAAFGALSSDRLQAVLSEVVEFVPSELQLTIQNGIVQTNVPEPYVLPLTRDDHARTADAPANLVVIDTKHEFSVSQLRAYHTRVWLARDALFIENSSGQVRAYALSSVPDGRYDRNTVRSIVAAINPWLRFVAPLAAVTLLLVHWLAGAFRLLYLLPVALVIWLVGKRLGLPWRYGQAYKSGVYAMTLAVLVELALELTRPWLHLYGIPFLFTALTMAVLAANLWAARRMGPQPPPVPAPLSVQSVLGLESATSKPRLVGGEHVLPANVAAWPLEAETAGAATSGEPSLTSPRKTAPPRTSWWRRANLAAVLIALVIAGLLGGGYSAYFYVRGSMADTRFATAVVLMVALLLAAGGFAIRWRRAHLLRLWLLPPAWMLAALGVFVAVDPGATWASRTVGSGATAGVYSFLTVGGHPVGVALAGDALWLTDYEKDRLLRIDPRSGKMVGNPVPVGRAPVGVALGEGGLWVANQDDGTVSRIDPATNRLVDIVKVGNRPQRVAVSAGFVWVTNMADGTVSRIDPQGRTPAATVFVGRSPLGLAAADDAVWVTHYEDAIVSRIDARTGRVVARVPVGRGPFSLGGTPDAVWVTNRDDNTVSRIDPRRNAVIQTIPVGNKPLGVAVTDDAVWVVNSGDGTLTRIDPAAGTVVGSPTRLGRTKESSGMVAASVGDVWVTNYAGSLQHVRLRETAGSSQASPRMLDSFALAW